MDYKLLNSRKEQYLTRSSRFGDHLNSIRIGKGETKEHAWAKAEQGIEDIFNDIPFYQEVEFTNGYFGRPDHLRILDDEIIEFLNTETEKDFDKKVARYPSKTFKIIPIKIRKVGEV